MEPRLEPPVAGVSPLRRDRLAQIHRRDPRAEGRFWYSVITTGVYCRPTCPARHARPENIRLHDTLYEARTTGFRPCARCRPEEPSLIDRQRLLIEAACRRIDHAPTPLPVSDLAAHAGLSVPHFYRLFRRITGTTPTRWTGRADIGAGSNGRRVGVERRC